VLEDRTVPTITYHGGLVLPRVEVQGVFLGSDWASPAYHGQVDYLDSFLNTVVNSSFMDAMTQAGYGVGRGVHDSGAVLPLNLAQNSSLGDGDIRGILQKAISSDFLRQPYTDRLYVVFVQDNVALYQGGGTTQTNLLGWHHSFDGVNAANIPAEIHYAVVAYPGGTVGNLSDPNFNALQVMTASAAREIADSATNPDGGGWFNDGAGGAEVGDLTQKYSYFLDDYHMPCLADPYGLPMMPAGASAEAPVSFALESGDPTSGGDLWVQEPWGWNFLAGNVSSISDQGIDNLGNPMIDVVTIDGQAWEYHDGRGWTFLANDASDARAGDSVSYVLNNGSNLWEYNDVSGQWAFLASGAAAIDAGTDRTGVNRVVALTADGNAWDHSDAAGWRYLGGDISQVSAGQQGLTAAVTTEETAWATMEGVFGWTYLAADITSVRAGTDAWGATLVTVTTNAGPTYDFDTTVGWRYLGSGLSWESKENNGVENAVYLGGMYQYYLGTWTFLRDDVAMTA
jgi:hypothetical protein